MKRSVIEVQEVEVTYGDDDVLQIGVIKVWMKLSRETSYRVK